MKRFGLVAILACTAGCGFDGVPPGGAADGAIATADAPLRQADAAAADAAPDAGLMVVARINVGGPEMDGIDRPGTFAADPGCSGSLQDAGAVDVFGTVDDDLFIEYRFGQVSCDVAVPAGDYIVRYHLAEMFRAGCYSNTPDRPMRLELEGTVVDTFDLVEESGGCVWNVDTPDARPFMREFPVIVSDGTLTVAALSASTNAQLHAFEVFAVP